MTGHADSVALYGTGAGYYVSGPFRMFHVKLGEQMSHAAIPETPAVPANTSTPVAPVTAAPVSPVDAVVADARKVNWPAVRLWFYGVTLASQPLLISYGLLNGSQSALWTDAIAAVLGVSASTVAIANVR